jgi:hypothetical protein
VHPVHETPKVRFGRSPIFANNGKITVREWLRVMRQHATTQGIGAQPPNPSTTPQERLTAQDVACIQWATTYLQPGVVTQRWYAELSALTRSGVNLTSWSLFEKHFCRVFGAPDPESDARNQIYMPQGNRSIHEWADLLYDKLAELEALGVPIDAGSQLFILRRYMNRELYDAIVLTQPSRNFTCARDILEDAKMYMNRVRDYDGFRAEKRQKFSDGSGNVLDLPPPPPHT